VRRCGGESSRCPDEVQKSSITWEGTCTVVVICGSRPPCTPGPLSAETLGHQGVDGPCRSGHDREQTNLRLPRRLPTRFVHHISPPTCDLHRRTCASIVKCIVASHPPLYTTANALALLGDLHSCRNLRPARAADSHASSPTHASMPCHYHNQPHHHAFAI
jgi:hypothetical protein